MLAVDCRRWIPYKLRESAKSPDRVLQEVKPREFAWATKDGGEQLDSMGKFTLRIVYIDYYMGERIYFPNDKDVIKTSEQRYVIPKIRPTQRTTSEKPQLYPIIRIFGRTPMGQTACIHIHEYLPYFFIHVSFKTVKKKFIGELICSLNEQTKNAVADAYFVYGQQMYGFKQGEDCFVKIELYNPDRIFQVSELLRTGKILGQTFQVYETHISYTMHFMSDYNLNGMGFIHLSNFSFRGTLPSFSQNSETWSSNKTWNSTHDANDRIWSSKLSELVPIQLTARVHPDIEELKEYYSSVKFPMRQCEGTCDLELDAPVFSVSNPVTSKALSSSTFKGTSNANVSSNELKSERVIPSLDSWWDEMSKFVDNSLEEMSLSPSESVSEHFYEDKESRKFKGILENWLEIFGDSTTPKSSPISTSSQEALKALKLMEAEEKEAMQDDSSISDPDEWESMRETRSEGHKGRSEQDEWEDIKLSQGDLKSELGQWNGIPDSSLEAPNPETLNNMNVFSLGDRVECRFRGEQGNQYFPCVIIGKEGTNFDVKYDKSNFVEKCVPSRFLRWPGQREKRIPQLDGTNDSDDEEVSQHERTQIVKGVARVYMPKRKAPLPDELTKEVGAKVIYQAPYFTNLEDAKQNQTAHFREGEKMRRNDSTYVTPQAHVDILPEKHYLRVDCLRAKRPPPPSYVVLDEMHRINSCKKQKKDVEDDPEKGTYKVSTETFAQVRLLFIEIYARSREGKLPNPEEDPLLGVVFYIVGNGLNGNIERQRFIPSGISFEALKQAEKALFQWIMEVISEFDPDIIAAYELQRTSLGYLFSRSKVLGLNHFARSLSRPCYGPQDRRHDQDDWGNQSHSGFWLVGRHILNVWRIIRSEVSLSIYSLQFVVLELLKERFPLYSNKTLQNWYESKQNHSRVGKYLLKRAKLTMRILDHLDIIVRTSELCSFIGADFFSVLTRGSQFRVESVLVRLSKRFNFLLPSPSKEQVRNQPALEEVALTLEPKSRMYINPVAVFDFRSLYPSIIIAYNLCFSTYVGRLESILNPMSNRLGFFPDFTHESKDVLRRMYKEGNLFVTPNGAVFVKESVRPGILPLMLREILDTRFRVKLAMKVAKSLKDYPWTRVLNARQLALKYIANVTYGYTSASFSGRMPCAELADSIVRLGRCSLLSAYSKIQSDWDHASVVYGDTDSAFVHLKGRTLKEAFSVSRDIALQVSQLYPSPMKLQFEKIYHPCLLQMKKRYCGMIYESEDEIDKKPRLEVKGMEIIRRDNCPLVRKIMKECIELLFTTKNLSQVKEHFEKYLQDILANRIPAKEFIVASKVKQGAYTNLPPSAVVAERRQMLDPMDYPLFKERIPYVVLCGSSSRLTDLVASPRFDSRLNARYYIERKILKPMDRAFILVGADVYAWWQSAKQKIPSTDRVPFPKPSSSHKSMIENYLNSETCALCRSKTRGEFCEDCEKDERMRMNAFLLKRKYVEKKAFKYIQICRKCDPVVGDQCISTDCDIYYVRNQAVSHYNW